MSTSIPKPFAATTRHGTDNAYVNFGCRCQPCATAHTAVQAEGDLRRAIRLKEGTGNPQHGRASTYTNWRCRCAPCTESHRIYMATRRARRAA